MYFITKGKECFFIHAAKPKAPAEPISQKFSSNITLLAWGIESPSAL